jgi:hypothetical protein
MGSQAQAIGLHPGSELKTLFMKVYIHCIGALQLYTQIRHNVILNLSQNINIYVLVLDYPKFDHSYLSLLFQDLIVFYKDIGLQSSATVTRNATTKLIGMLHKFGGQGHLVVLLF